MPLYIELFSEGGVYSVLGEYLKGTSFQPSKLTPILEY